MHANATGSDFYEDLAVANLRLRHVFDLEYRRISRCSDNDCLHIVIDSIASNDVPTTTINIQRGPGYVRRRRGTEEDDRVGYFFGRAGSSKRDVA